MTRRNALFVCLCHSEVEVRAGDKDLLPFLASQAQVKCGFCWRPVQAFNKLYRANDPGSTPHHSELQVTILSTRNNVTASFMANKRRVGLAWSNLSPGHSYILARSGNEAKLFMVRKSSPPKTARTEENCCILCTPPPLPYGLSAVSSVDISSTPEYNQTNCLIQETNTVFDKEQKHNINYVPTLTCAATETWKKCS